jgi:MraZ protein
MSDDSRIILGEYRRTLDERFRLALPAELLGLLPGTPAECVLVKERAGCLSLWDNERWRKKLNARVRLIEEKIQADMFSEDRVGQVQLLGRLLSTRHRDVTLSGRGRLLIPEGFREFLGVEAGGEVLVVGAALCIEIWRPRAWIEYVERRMPKFRRLFEKLAR